VTDDVYEAWMRKLAAAVHEVGATFRVKDYKRGFSAAPSTSFVQQAQDVLAEMGLDGSLYKLAQTTEANVFNRMGIECLVWGPGQSVGNSHAPNENIKIADLQSAAEFYRRFLERFCL
jgi:acetylornithine deacetylase/succinyl-diaminopimelate desuccinylase-like protein